MLIILFTSFFSSSKLDLKIDVFFGNAQNKSYFMAILGDKRMSDTKKQTGLKYWV